MTKMMAISRGLCHRGPPSAVAFQLLPLLCCSSLLFTAFSLAFPELSVQLKFRAVPEFEQLLSHLLIGHQNRFRDSVSSRKSNKTERRRQQPIGSTKVPMLFGTAEMGFFIEFQRDKHEEGMLASAESLQVDERMPKMAAQFDYFMPNGGRMSTIGGAYGGNSYGMAADTVNFDFQCKCQAKSALARTLNTPLSSDPNQAAQQQIQQLQEQVRKLQQQIDRSQQGKSSFEQFAQMLALADGLDCSCSGQSTPWTGWPSGVLGGNNGFPGGGGGANPFAGGRFTSGGPLSQAGMGVGNGHFPMGGGGVPMPMGVRPMAGGNFPGQLYPGYPMSLMAAASRRL